VFGVQFTASFEAHRGEGEDTELHLWDKTSYRKSDEIAAAWDECSFGVIVRSGNKDKLEAVFKALCDKDAAIMLGGGGCVPERRVVFIHHLQEQAKQESA